MHFASNHPGRALSAAAAACLSLAAALVPLSTHAQTSTGETRVRCESNAGAEASCAARIVGGVRLLRSFGSTPCREGSTWRHDSRGIHVRNGCRGEFAYRSGGGSGSGWGGGWSDSTLSVRCSSNDGREAFCAIENRGVTLRKQESRASCVEGQTWRADRRGVYVRQGCRGLFEVRQGSSGAGWDNGNGWGSGGEPYAIKCQSIGGRWGACPVDIGGAVRLVKKESHAECVRGWTWGLIGREAIWVSNGCRAVFEVQNGRAATGRKVYGGSGEAPPGIERRKEE